MTWVTADAQPPQNDQLTNQPTLTVPGLPALPAVRQRMNFITLDQGSVSSDNSHQLYQLPQPSQPFSAGASADPTQSNTNHSHQGLYARHYMNTTDGGAGEGTNESSRVWRFLRSGAALAGQGGSQPNLPGGPGAWQPHDLSARSGEWWEG